MLCLNSRVASVSNPLCVFLHIHTYIHVFSEFSDFLRQFDKTRITAVTAPVTLGTLESHCLWRAPCMYERKCWQNSNLLILGRRYSTVWKIVKF